MKDLSIPHEIILIKTTSKQLFLDVLQNRCSKKYRNIHMKTTVLEFLFNKAAAHRALPLLKNTRIRVFSSKFCEMFYRTCPVAFSETSRKSPAADDNKLKTNNNL